MKNLLETNLTSLEKLFLRVWLSRQDPEDFAQYPMTLIDVVEEILEYEGVTITYGTAKGVLGSLTKKGFVWSCEDNVIWLENIFRDDQKLFDAVLELANQK